MFYSVKILQETLNFCYRLYKLKRNIKLTSTQLKDIRKYKLRSLLRHSYDKVPYYQRLFNQTNIKPEDIKTIDDLQKIPISRRRVLQTVPIEEKVSRGVNIAQCTKLRTSGSTGKPMDVFIEPYEIIWRISSYLRMHFENGRKIKDKILFITTSHNFLAKQWYHFWFYRLKILRGKHISLYKGIEYFLSEMARYKPDIIFSYSSIIKELAQQIKERNIKMIRPRLVFVTGEMLSDEDRRFIQTVFKSDVFDHYACNECGLIAWECRNHTGYHTEYDNVIVELVKDGKPVPLGEEGEVVITALNQYAMPFIRYKLGDIATLADYQCKCGSNFPLLKFIKGRINDCLTLPNGKVISPYILMTTMDKIREVTHYQIIQEEVDKIRIKVVENSTLSLGVINKIKEVYRNLTDASAGIEIDICREIDRGPGYKNKVVISKIEPRDIKTN